MHSVGKIGIAGSRLYVIEFDEKKDLLKLDKKEKVYPIRVEINYIDNELIVCTRKDVRILDFLTGSVKKIY